jgi:molybdenum cofactor cytidylyltransferase
MARLAAVVLAAGASSRFGDGNKLIAPIEGRALVRRAAEAMLAAGPYEVIVVTGHEPAPIEAALAGLSVRSVHNAGWQAGLSSSIASGVAALGPHIDGAFIVPGDMPFLDPATIRELAATFENAPTPPIVYPATAAGEQRNPVLWPRRHFAELISLPGPDGAKQLLRSVKGSCAAVAVRSELMFTDVDTPADLDAAAVASRRED